MQLAIVILLGIGAILIYAAVSGKSPREIIAETFGTSNA